MKSKRKLEVYFIAIAQELDLPVEAVIENYLDMTVEAFGRDLIRIHQE